MSRSIFLTGSGGFLGKRVLQRLARKENYQVVCLTRGNAADPSLPNVSYVRGDLLDPETYRDGLKGCDTVLHMAAATGKHSPEEFRRVNGEGTGSLVRQARESGVERFLFVSSIAAKFRDQFRYFYAQSKQEAETMVAASGLRWTIVRPTMIFGKNSPVLDGLARLVGLPVVPVFGDGRVPVQPIFVDDLADSLVALLEENGFDGATLEVGGPEVLTIENLMLRIRQTIGKRSAPVLHLPAGLIGRCLGLMEPLLLPLLPLTAGQLASFSNAGTTAPHPWVAERQPRMLGVSAMLKSSGNGYDPA